MPEKKSCNSKCYCSKNPVSCQFTQRSLGKTIFSNRSVAEISNSISIPKSKFEFVKLKREYDGVSTPGKSCTLHRGHVNFSRRSSTSTVDSTATSLSASTTSFCNCCNQQNQQKLLPTANNNWAARVNKLKYSDRRTFYEYLRQAEEQHGNLPTANNINEEEERITKPTNKYLFDEAYLKELQEFRLRNRSECFG